MTYDPAQARNNHGEFGTTDVPLKGAAATSAIVTQRPINTAAHKGAVTPEEAQAQATLVAAGAKPLDGLPQKPIQLADQWYVPGPIGRLKDAADSYMKSAGLPYSPPTEYAKLLGGDGQGNARAVGDDEENAWRSHAAMYLDLARPAMTNETRGQNSWVNYDPHGVTNRTADAEHTIFAPQKIGLMPEWTANEGRK